MKKTRSGKPAYRAGNSSNAIHTIGRALAAFVFLLFILPSSGAFAQTAPTITGIGFTADPTGGREYHTTGDTIVIAVNFSENITVNPAPPYDEDDSAVPTIDLEIGNSIRAVRLHGEYGTFVLFIYTVQERDTDLDGNFRLLANSLRLNGATIQSSDDMANADLSHEEKTCCGYNVLTLRQRRVLEILYDATGGPDWMFQSSGWNGGDLSIYDDILVQNIGRDATADSTTGQYVGLSLWGLNLTGTIPTELGELTSLQSLRLDRNSLSGTIPSELGNLTKLTRMDLWNNELSGTIPSELGNLTKLTRMDLYSNELSGTIPSELGNLTSLTEMNLYSNNLSGTIPSELGNLTSLTRMNLYSNNLSGTIPAELGDLTKLSQLLLYTNMLEGSIPTKLGELTLLEDLDLSKNNLSGTIPAELMGLGTLIDLDLSNNQLSGAIPAGLGNLTTQLRELLLHSNNLSGTIPTELGSLTQLIIDLDLSNNQLSGTIPTELGNLTGLNNLLLHSNNLSGTIPPEVVRMANLVDLDLSNNQLSGTIPAGLWNNDIRKLYFDNNMLTGSSIPSELEALAALNLRELRLWGNEGFTGTVVSNELGKRVDRAVLRVLYNDNGGLGWTSNDLWFPPYPNEDRTKIFSFGEWYGVSANDDGRVSALNLNDNNLTGPIANVLEELEHLETLNLADNPMLSGTLPEGLFSEGSPLTVVNIENTNICTPNTQEFNDWLGNSDTSFTGSECSAAPPDTGQPDPPDTGQPDPPDTGQPDPPDTGQPDPPDTGQPDPPDTGQPDPPDTGQPDPPDTGQPDPPDTGQPDPPDTGQPDPPDTGQPDPPDTGQPDPPDTGQPDPPDTGQPDPPDGDGGGGGCVLAPESWGEDRPVSGLLNLFLIVSFLLGVSLKGRLKPKRE